MMKTTNSAEHCRPCAFGGVEPASPGRSLRAEGDLVRDHLQEVCDPGNTGYSSRRMQEAALDDGVDPERLMAARVCAGMILNGQCEAYIFIKRGRGNNFNLEPRVINQ